MRVSVIGLGYVGAVCCGCLAREGNLVLGVDINESNVSAINSGKAPVFEPGLEQRIRGAVGSGWLKATLDARGAIQETDVTLISVPTPSKESGELDLSYVRTALEQVGKALGGKDGRHIVVMRSTVLPGTGRKLAIPVLEEASGGRNGENFGYVSNPEFLREGTAIADFHHPPTTVIGSDDTFSCAEVERLYEHLDAPVVRTTIENAEMLKYADNAWHAAKVAFANEIGNIAREVGLDGQSVMRDFCLDTKLNLSSYYLNPGYAYGGSCLPKDLNALLFMADELGVTTPLLSSVSKSNDQQIERAFNMIQETGIRKVAILGLSFKGDTDDLRGSPQLRLAERLVETDHQLVVYDPSINRSLSEPSGERLRAGYPHVLPWLEHTIEEALEKSELIVVGNSSSEFRDIDNQVSAEHVVLDLVRVSQRRSGGRYLGICW